MGRPIEITGIHIHAQTTPCANHCRYCQLGHKQLSNITFARFESVVGRFIEWKEERGLVDFGVGHWLSRSHNYDTNTLKGVMDLIERQSGLRLDLILLGGLYWRPETGRKAIHTGHIQERSAW